MFSSFSIKTAAASATKVLMAKERKYASLSVDFIKLVYFFVFIFSFTKLIRYSNANSSSISPKLIPSSKSIIV